MWWPVLARVTLVLLLTHRSYGSTPPLFTSPSSFTIPEDTAIGATIGTLSVIDSDNDTIAVSLVSTAVFYVALTAVTSVPGSYSANITLKRELDYESTSVMLLSFEAIDINTVNAVRKQIRFVITDVNDNPPRFQNQPYSTQIPENTSTGRAVFTVSATDNENGNGGQVNLTLLTNTDTFSVADNGTVTLNEAVDYETLSFYHLRLRATDGGGLYSNASLFVTVTDVQDCPPYFTSLPYLTDISENCSVNTSIYNVSAQDGDRGNPDNITFIQKTSTCPGYFEVHPDGGIILKTTADRDNGTIFTNNGICVLTVEASEDIVSSLPQYGNNTTATETVTVTINDVNDNDPIFSASVYTASIRENSPPGVPLTFLSSPLTVEDRDQGDFAKFNLTLDNYVGDFELVPSTVQGSASVLVRVKNSSILDYERRQNITLTIWTTQLGRQNSSATVHLHIENENDNTPSFQHSEYNTSVEEGSSVSTSVVTISANDTDLPPYNQISYNLLGADEKFAISPSGEVTVASNDTDRETRPVYYLTVEAADNYGRKQTTQLTVTITDANDNSPQFNRDYDGYLTENSKHFNRPIKIQATDDDIGLNAQIRYSIDRTYPPTLESHFHVDNTTGDLSVERSLNYENLASAQLIVEVKATDFGKPSRSTDVNVTLTVQDENDNAPTFHPTSYRERVSEAAPVDASILQVFATDSDGTLQNNATFYMLEGTGSDRFQINGATGVIAKVGKLDAEDISQYNLTVTAMDRGNPPRNSTASVVIHVDNVNDEKPTFPLELMSMQVNETNKRGIIFNITAKDKDADSDLNYTVVWGESSAYNEDSIAVSISRIQQILTVNGSNGDLVLIDKLDREEVEVITLKLHVADLNAVINNPQTATATLRLTVMDVDDNSPEFNRSSYTATIEENTQPGIPISLETSDAITVSDADKDQNGVFSLSLLNYSSVFEVIPSTVRSIATVIIRVKDSSQLDYENTSSMTLTLMAIETDASHPRSSNVTIFLNITDANDNDPVFVANSYNKTIPENSPPGYFVVTVKATDKDSAKFGMGNYSLQGTQSNFEINKDTGKVTVASGSDLDYEKQPTYWLRVEAEDKGGRRASVILTVHLSDTNDSPPHFTRIDYNANLKENSANFVQAFQLEATDADQEGTSNALVSYELYSESSSIAANFSINNTTGILTPKSPIDYESLPSGPNVKVVVIATDHGIPQLSSNITVTIQVEDINDNTPLFNQTSYRGNVSEDAVTDTSILQVFATDNDGTLQNNATFYMLEGTGSDRFQIDGATGVIAIVGKLDAEDVSQFSLTVRVIDRGNPPRNSTASVVIDVDNVNDETPIFPSELISEQVKETDAVGRVLYTISAVDADQDADLRYSVIWGNSSASNEDLQAVNMSKIKQILQLNDATGELLVNGNLDREEVEVITLKLHVVDQNAQNVTPQTATATLRLTVMDIDDNSPEFNNQTYTAEIEENSQPGIPIYLQSPQSITVSDKDKDLNSVFSLSLLSHSDVFEVVPKNVRSSATVIIKVKNNTQLDYETIKTMNLTLLANETRVLHPLQSSVTILLNITDANDHNPVFNKTEYNVSIPENSANDFSVVEVMATDEDSSRFDMGTYSLQGSQSSFKINKATGQVYVADGSDLDRERQPTFHLRVEAVDKGGLRSSVPVNVHLTDENDNRPVFTRVEYNANLKEGDMNFSRPLIIQTTDADEKETNNVLVSYELLSSSSGLAANFSIGNVSGILTPNSPIDYELLRSRPNIDLVVIATDHGIPPLSSNVTVTIQVEDINDNTPLFNSSSFNGNIKEWAGTDTSILQVFATDKDGTPQNSDIFYMLEGTGSDRFRIGGDTGIITNTGKLDREDVPQYNLTVRVMDRGTPPLDSTAEVMIDVINVNDEVPSFSSELISRQINETNNVGKVLYTASATDLDSDSDLLYTIFWNESSAVDDDLQGVSISQVQAIMRLNNSTGQLQLIDDLDREAVEVITLKLHVVDLNAVEKLPQTATATLRLTVMDVDDNAPRFNNSVYRADIEENSQPGIPITLESFEAIKVADRDKDFNSVFSLSLLSHSDVFEVVPENVRSSATVIIRVKNSTQLDFEKNKTMTLILLANETRAANHLSSSAIIYLSIKDVNDHTPVFGNDSYIVSIPENSINGYDVLNVTATDQDSSLFGMGTYNLQGSQSGFAISNVMGQVHVANGSYLDRERQPTFHLRVEAVDKGGLRSSVPITVHLTDENDNSPVFARVEYNANLKEGDMNFSRPLIIQTTDADEEGTNNTEVSYKLQSPSSGTEANFSISTVGVLTPNRPIDYELLSRPNIDLLVIATDHGKPPRSSNVTVTIQVQDINDNTPHFNQSSYNGNISEGVKKDTAILQVFATDKDATTQNSAVFYMLEGTGSDRFRIDGGTGIITNMGKLDREDVSYYNLTVRVMDRGTPPLNSTAEVTIDISNVNDERPSFPSQSMSKQVNETNNNGTVLYSASAEDNDPDSSLFYSVLWDESSAYNEDVETVNISRIQRILQLDTTTGDLVLIDDLDREEVEVITLKLHVLDRNAKANLPQTATATLTLAVMDVDDNTPTFNNSVYIAEIKENSQPGIPISLESSGAITVSDEDKDLNSVFSLSLLTHNDVFEVVPENVRSSATVIIRVKESTQLDYEETKSMNITLLAKETRVSNPRNSSVEIFLSIKDDNDNNPRFNRTSYTVSIPENSDRGYRVVNVTATDKDSAQFNMGNYSLQGSQNSFAINSVTGEVYVANGSDLNRERQVTFRLTVEAVDKGGRRSSAPITVHLTDVNDNSPVFSRKEYNANLKENDDHFSRTLKIQATDDDEKNTNNSLVSYSILPQSTGLDANFSIDEMGILTPKGPIDFELLTNGSSTIDLLVVATDHGNPTLTSNVTVSIQVQDVNDNTPIFNQTSYRGNISEAARNNKAILQVFATDKDGTPQNSEVFYMLEGTGSDRFQINGATGVIANVGELNREDVSQYNLTVRVMDRGIPPLNSTADVIIDVINVNDVVPTFPSASVSKQVNETNSAGSVLYTLSAIDLDPDSNLFYTVFWNESSAYDEDLKNVNMTRIQEILRLNNATGGLVLTDVLDREEVEVITLKLHVVDLNAEDNNPQTASAMLRLTVMDVDDNTPTFNKDMYTAEIEENSQPGIPISLESPSVITVSDKDKDLNSIFSLSLLNYSDVFDVVPSIVRSSATVIIRVKNSTQLDYEVTQSMELTLLANETRVSNPHNSTVKIFLSIKNVNDHFPVFENNSYTVRIPENRMFNYHVVNVTATDADRPEFDMDYYQLQGSQTNFAINNVTGEVYVANASDLDREKQVTYRLTVEAVDKGGRRSSVPITVHLTDVNDNSPVFRRVEYNANLKEGNDSFSRPLVIKTTDADKEQTANSMVTYSIQSTDGLEGNFSINDTGILSPNSPIDYELLPNPPNIALQVIATDGGLPQLSSNVTVTIQVEDINDNKPTFVDEPYHASIPENAKDGSFVTSVSGRDKDGRAPNNQIRFVIDSGGSDNFRVNGRSGNITVQTGSTLDREKVQNYTLFIMVIDQGTPPLSSSTTVSVTITDINDEPPVFDEDVNDGNVMENCTTEIAVYKMVASDPDENSTLRFSILWDDSRAFDESDSYVNVTKVKNWFSINQTTGEVSAEPYVIDRETAERVTLRIQVTDLLEVENTPQVTNGSLTVTVEDKNDNFPEIAQGSRISLNVSEGTMVGTVIMSLDASDRDKRQTVTFSTTDHSFNVTKEGRISLAAQLDRETNDALSFTVLATDDGQTPLTSTATISVIVLDTNDNDPYFSMTKDVFSVAENSPNGTFVAQLVAFDNDTGPNANVTFLFPDYFGSHFTINATSGEIQLGKTVDRETRSSYSLTVVARDNPTFEEPRRVRRTIKIDITDVNDNNPIFKDNYNTKVSERTDRGGAIITVTATDADIGNNARIWYSIDKTFGNGSHLFDIDPDSGGITAERNLTGLADTYVLRVVATDMGKGNLTGNTNVTVIVLDENLNHPLFVDDGDISPVPECARPNSLIYQFNATDADRDKVHNGHVEFKMSDDTPQDTKNHFQLEESGKLFTDKNNKLDSETQDRFVLKVSAYDLGIPSLSTLSREYIIKITDFNDHPPKFNKSDMREEDFSLDENLLNVTLGPIRAEDPDKDSSICYSISGVTPYAQHYVDQLKTVPSDNRSAYIQVMKPFDRENVTSFQVKVTATDCSQIYYEKLCGITSVIQVSATTTLTIHVNDVNDNPPKFNTDLIPVGIRNTVPAQKVIYKLENKVTDPDTPANSQHRYTQVNATRADAQLLASSYTPDPTKPPIVLNGNGTVKTNRTFTGNVGYLSMTVAVSDSAGISFTELRIFIIADFQVLKITFLQSPEELRLIQETVLKKLSEDTGKTFVINDDIVSPTDANGNVIPSRSVMFVHAWDPATRKILDAESSRKAIDSNRELTGYIISKYKVLHVGEADAVATEEDDGKRQTFILIAIIALLAFTLCLLVFISFNRIHRYRRKLKAATIEISVPKRQDKEESGVVNINPIFNKEIALRQEADPDTTSLTSDDSLDDNEVLSGGRQKKVVDDEQEITVNFFDEENQIRYGNNYLGEALRRYDFIDEEMGQRGHDVGDSASSGSDHGESHNKKKFISLEDNERFGSLEDLESTEI